MRVNQLSAIYLLCVKVSASQCVFVSHSQEEETARLQAAKRRLQRELDELTDQNEQLQRDVARKGYVPYTIHEYIAGLQYRKR